MSEITHLDTVPFSKEELQQIESELKGKILEILGNENLHNDICHRKAVKIAKMLIAGLDLTKYQVRLVQITGHSAVSITNLSMTSVGDSESGLKVLINTGFPPEEIPDDFYTIFPGRDFSNLLPENLKWIESIPLLTGEDAQKAMAWSTGEAKRNRDYYIK